MAKMKPVFKGEGIVTSHVDVEIYNQDVIDRCFTDEWNAEHHDFTDARDIVEHFALNFVENGNFPFELEGWEDISYDDVKIESKQVYTDFKDW